MKITKKQFRTVFKNLKDKFNNGKDTPQGRIKVIKTTKELEVVEIRTTDIISKTHIHEALFNCDNYSIKIENGEIIIVLEYSTNRKELQEELHQLKRKVELCKFNNLNYREYEKRIAIITKQLGYHTREKNNQKNKFNTFREAPSEHIKIYLGGR